MSLLELLDCIILGAGAGGLVIVFAIVIDQLFEESQRRKYYRDRRSERRRKDNISQWKSNEAERLMLKNNFNPTTIKRRVLWFKSEMGFRAEKRVSINRSVGSGPAYYHWTETISPFTLRLAGWDESKSETQHKEFKDEIKMRCWLIRQAYAGNETVLIPSEILSEAGLRYTNNRWVDTWTEVTGSQFVVCWGITIPPTNRRLRLPARPGLQHNLKKSSSKKVKPRIIAKVPWVERRLLNIKPKIELSDDACFYTFSAGENYKKDQNPLKNPCENSG